MVIQAFLSRGVGALQAGFLGHEHVDELGTAQQQGLQLLGLHIVERTHDGFDDGGEMSDDERVDAVCLRTLAGGFGKVAHLSRIDGDSGKTGLTKRLEYGEFELAGGLHDDQGGIQRDQTLDQLVDGDGFIVDTEMFGGVVDGNVEGAAADVDADINGRESVVHHGTHTCRKIRARGSVNCSG
ncbi:hypothetical protein R69888_07021 [Paraburkholderia haematera]|uniref:Uncharacterized protein n=1 Tax=Paraburkholderia haematera TaxID=2793077 RepID=A0ABN7N3T9_9BURK|nr:hypothetical protein R69888_07021 [Paraburkholderia haematera]